MKFDRFLPMTSPLGWTGVYVSTPAFPEIDFLTLCNPLKYISEGIYA